MTTINNVQTPTKLFIPKWKIDQADWVAFAVNCDKVIDRAIQSDDVGRFADRFTEGMLTATADTIPQTSSFQKRFSPWWNKQCVIAVKNKKTRFLSIKKNR